MPVFWYSVVRNGVIVEESFYSVLSHSESEAWSIFYGWLLSSFGVWPTQVILFAILD